MSMVKFYSIMALSCWIVMLFFGFWGIVSFLFIGIVGLLFTICVGYLGMGIPKEERWQNKDSKTHRSKTE